MTETLDFRDAAAVVEVLQEAASLLRGSSLRKGSAVRLPGVSSETGGRLLLTGDLHDNPVHLQKIVKLARLNQSSQHHVVLHEMIHSERLVNNLDFSHRTLIKVAQLIVKHPLQVHPLLANHELAQLTGKGVSKGAGNSVVMFEDGLAFAFGDDSELVSDAIRQFIASMALALVTESGVLCAHSLPSSRMMTRFDAGVLERELKAEDYESPYGAAHLMVWGRDHSREQLEELSGRWNVKLFVVGHEHAETGIELKCPRMLVLNSDHERGVVVPMDLGRDPDAEELLMSAIPLAAVT